MWVNLPTIVNTWVNATEVNFWVKTLVVGDGEDVVHRYVELEVLEPAVELLEGVTQREALEAQIVALLDEAVRWDVRTSILCATVGDELLKDVLAACEEVRCSIVSAESVIYIVAEYACEECRSAPVLVVEIVAPTEVYLRLSTTSDSAVLEVWVAICLAVALAILVTSVIN